MLFPGAAGDLDLFTDEEVFALTRIRSIEIPQSLAHPIPTYHHLPPGWSQAHPLGNVAT